MNLFFDKKIKIAVGIVLFLGILIAPIFAKADSEYPVNVTIYIENGKSYDARAVYYDYKDNIYISLRDVAASLSGTSKACDVAVNNNSIKIQTNKDYLPLGGENVHFQNAYNRFFQGEDFSASLNQLSENNVSDNSVSANENEEAVSDNSLANEEEEETLTNNIIIYYNLKFTSIYIDDVERKYAVLFIPNSEGKADAYVSLNDLSMFLDIDIKIDGTDIYINPDKGFEVNIADLERMGYFNMVNSIVVGDATTGEIYYESDGSRVVPMASVTKLMTYLVAMDAVKNGSISENQLLTCSKNAEIISYTGDRVLYLKEGDTIAFKDALIGMLLPSSNEIALAVAENVAGTEGAFVKRMNEKAKEIGLSDNVRFYNCNGLPTFTNTAINIKRQNMITAVDMFKLVSYIMNVYPQVADITSIKSYRLEDFKIDLTNTNMTLFNVDEVIGLKTGTTTKAGACLVSVAKVKKEDGDHFIVVAMFGAENGVYRSMISETMLRYGIMRAKNEEPSLGHSDENTSAIKDISTPEKLIQTLLN